MHVNSGWGKKTSFWQKWKLADFGSVRAPVYENLRHTGLIDFKVPQDTLLSNSQGYLLKYHQNSSMKEIFFYKNKTVYFKWYNQLLIKRIKAILHYLRRVLTNHFFKNCIHLRSKRTNKQKTNTHTHTLVPKKQKVKFRNKIHMCHGKAAFWKRHFPYVWG